MEKLKISACLQSVSNTRSKVKEPCASLDCAKVRILASVAREYRDEWRGGESRCSYINCACVVTLDGHNRLAASSELDLVLRPEPGHNLDAVRIRHDGGPRSAQMRAVSWERRTSARARK